MPTKWDTRRLRAGMENGKKCLLEASGQVVQNQMVEMAHIQTGALKNSINYQVGGNGKWSGFGNIVGPRAKSGNNIPSQSAKVSMPSGDSVRIGSALVYAVSQEKVNGFASRAFDYIIAAGSLRRVVFECMKKGLK